MLIRKHSPTYSPILWCVANCIHKFKHAKRSKFTPKHPHTRTHIRNVCKACGNQNFVGSSVWKAVIELHCAVAIWRPRTIFNLCHGLLGFRRIWRSEVWHFSRKPAVSHIKMALLRKMLGRSPWLLPTITLQCVLLTIRPEAGRPLYIARCNSCKVDDENICNAH